MDQLAPFEVRDENQLDVLLLNRMAHLVSRIEGATTKNLEDFFLKEMWLLAKGLTPGARAALEKGVRV